MNAYEKSQQLGLTGSDSEIVAILQTLTARPIELWQLREYFRQTQILIRGRTGWTGPLAAVESPVIDLLIDALDDSRQTIIDSDKPVWGPAFYDGLAMLVAGEVITPEQAEGVQALGGGLPFSALTEQDFASQRADALAAAARQEALNSVVSRANAAIAAASQAVSEGLEPGEIVDAADNAWEV